ncbi:reverse transcriptase domain-containing protein [Tanacetum coccineum]
MFPFRDIRRIVSTEEVFNWKSRVEDALQEIKRKLGKLQTLAVPKEGETIMGQRGDKWPHGKSTKKFRDLRMIGSVGCGIKDIPYLIYSNGGSKRPDSEKVFQIRRTNDMDYEALRAGLAASVEIQIKDLYVFVSSKILVDQVEGNREPKKEGAKMYMEEVMDATTLFHRFEFLNQEVSVGVKTRPSIEDLDKLPKETKNLSKKINIGKVEFHLGIS